MLVLVCANGRGEKDESKCTLFGTTTEERQKVCHSVCCEEHWAVKHYKCFAKR